MLLRIKRKQNLTLIRNLSSSIKASTMGSNKKRIENLKIGLGKLHDNFSQMELGVTFNLHKLEDAINILLEALFLGANSPSK